jgi:methylmalonyl-CoA mutase C-terminal domain/subunit
MVKTSLDGHWRGLYVVTMALRDGGMEVLHGGELTAEEIVNVAVQEDVDVIGLGIGGRYHLIRRMFELLEERGVDDVLVIAGGTIPREDIPMLKKMGVAGVFPPGSSLESIVDFVDENARAREEVG